MNNLRDSKTARWTALVFLAFAMFCAYIFMDILSPVKSILESTRGWDSTAFGTYAGSETFLNVFIGFLIFAGIILDKMGVRFTALLSGFVMILGAAINWYSVTEMFVGTGLEAWFNHNLNYIPGFDELGVSPFYRGMPASAKLASVGFMVFGCGVEMAGITVSRGIVKWFKGKELALAMGSEMALARLGVASCMIFSPLIAKANIFGGANVSHSVAFGVLLLIIAFIMFIAYFFMDKKLDAQGIAEEKDDPFKVRDIGKIFASSGFWLVALLCVLYYSAIFPFQKYAVNMLQCNLGFSETQAGTVFAFFPILAAIITPFLGNFIDRRGKAASMLMLGSILLIVCHLIFAFVLPMFRPEIAANGEVIGEASMAGIVLALTTILILGASFSLVPASLWPSVPKLVDSKVIGSAYALIFWIQNIGLWLFPLLIGKILTSSNQDVINSTIIDDKFKPVLYDYTNPLVMLACLGAVALVLGFILKIVDKKKGLGLELPNIKK
ncbi:MAG: MFS transporter [Bacteroidales bacterium]|nr:MFS transporter [Bacteroidales bacterium]